MAQNINYSGFVSCLHCDENTRYGHFPVAANPIQLSTEYDKVPETIIKFLLNIDRLK